jgi:hypothetical protein
MKRLHEIRFGRTRAVPSVIAAAGLMLLMLCPSGAQAFPFMADKENQPNKVIRLSDYPVTIEFGEKDGRVAEYVAKICGGALPRLMGQLELAEVTPIRVIIVPKMQAFRSQEGPDYPEWGAAFAFMSKQFMVVDVQKAVRTWDSLDKTIPHELSHLLLAQKVGPVPMPAWFLEGLAQWQAGQGSMTDSWRLMSTVWSGRYPSLMQITIGFPADEGSARTAYRISLVAFQMLFDGQDLPSSLPLFLGTIGQEKDFNEALVKFRGEDLHQYSARFGRELARKYTNHLLIFQEGPLFSILAVLFVFMILSVRLRSRRKLKRLEMEERGLSD